MLRRLLVALVGVSLALNTRAEPDDSLGTPFTNENTLLLSVHKSPIGVKQHIKQGAKLLHAKVLGDDLKQEALLAMLRDIAEQKAMECPWWKFWCYPTPIHVVLEQSEHKEEQFTSNACKQTAGKMQAAVVTAAAHHPGWMFGRWDVTQPEDSLKWGVINVLMGGYMPRECVEFLLTRGGATDSDSVDRQPESVWYVGVAPEMAKRLNQHNKLDLSFDSKGEATVKLMSLPFRDVTMPSHFEQRLAMVPEVVKLLITHIPAGGQALLEQWNWRHPNKLVLTKDASLPNPSDAPIAEGLWESELHQVASCLNIEAGKPHFALVKTGEDKKWFNLDVIVDRPFVQEMTLEEITKIAKEKGYKLKESAIDGFSDAQANHAYLLVTSYLIDNVRKIAQVGDDEVARVTIQVHRKSSAKPHIELIIAMLQAFYAGHSIETGEFEVTDGQKFRTTFALPDQKVEVVFCNGWDDEDFTGYEDTHVLFSLGIVLGLAHELPSGSCVVTDTFIPFDSSNSVLFYNKEYTAPNHLIHALTKDADLLGDERQDRVLAIINEHAAFQSPVQDKVDRAHKMTVGDFNRGPMLEGVGLWNPDAHTPKFVKIVSETVTLQ
eukprot:GDKI01038235.1.p1 GENE.GDKI01038235.1~~GDKI01038235.1.p1  ORF type:complete len:605 (-),score=201.06 GDKI01038235.1:240-2054(-)